MRIGEEPIAVQSNGRSVTFHFEGDRWLTSKLLEIGDWPDPGRLLDVVCEPMHIDDSLFNAVDKLRPFMDKMNSVWLHEDGTVSTADNETDGAHLQSTTLGPLCGRYSADQLLRLRGVAERMDFSLYPKPCPFFGDAVRGVIIGLAT